MPEQGQVSLLTPVIPTFWEVEAGGLLEFETNLGNILRPYLYKKKSKKIASHDGTCLWSQLLGRLS